MIVIGWNAVLTGAGIGVVMSVIYFAGLALGMRCALRGANPVAILTLSAALRIVMLLAVAWSVVSLMGPWAAAGFAAAFLVARFAATTVARAGTP